MIELPDSKEKKINVPPQMTKKIVKSTIAVKTQDGTYEYDKYDIIDFLEQDYIDWLNSIPSECWDKYKKDVEKSFYKITDEQVMDLVMGKIKINLPKYVLDNFEKITLQVLKYCVKTNFTKLDTQIKKNDYKLNDYKLNVYIEVSIEKRDLEFNKYFYEDLYFKLEPSHQCKYLGANTDGNFFLLEGIWIHKDNRFYKIIKNEMSLPSYRFMISNYKLIKYFNDIFPNIFQHNIQIKDYLHHLYVITFKESKIDNINDMIELKNILNISNNDFIQKMLIGKDIYNYDVSNNKYLLLLICESGNVELVFKTINTFWSDELKKKANIINIMAFSSLSKNYELVLLLYNFFTFEKNFSFDVFTCSRIAGKIIMLSDNKYHEHDKILYEWFNLGGIVKGSSIYTDYIKTIKIIKKKK